MPYSAVIFDFDFTLIDATEGILKCFNRALTETGWPSAGRETVRRTVGMPLAAAYTQITGDTSERKIERFLEVYSAEAEISFLDNLKLFPDTVESLTRLKLHDLKTAIVTNRRASRVHEILERYALSDFFDFVVGIEMVDEPKPSPKGLLLALSELESAPEQAVYIGDTVIDAETAQNAGVDFYAVITGTTQKLDFYEWPHKQTAPSLSLLVDALLSNDSF